MANDLPNPQSYEQLLADMLSAYAAKQGINDFNVGSAVTDFFSVIALTTARSSGDIFQILRDFSVDRATGDALKRLATENRVTLITAKPSTGYVAVTDTSIQKILTKIYAGTNPPNIGSSQIRVSDASIFPATGAVYIGRGTPNVEGPISYTSIAPVGGYYILNLASATTKFHNVGESIILSQGGNRSVPVNSIVSSPSSGASSDIQFSVTVAAVILDGEVSVSNVQVSAQTPGASGNVPRGAIKQFSSAPFSGASVANALPFTTGRDSETDDELRVRIKRAIASIGLGTATAIKSAVIGATPSDEQATIVSDEIVSDANGAILYIDDGSGYEAKTAGVGLESIVDSALGGEKYFQLVTGGRQSPIAKAFLESIFAAPFDLIKGDTLAITVGEQTYQHVFASTDFRSSGGATAFEITASINANTTLGFEAATSNGGQNVIIRAKLEGNDALKTATPTTSGRNASVQLGLPANEIQTLRLYKNKLPLSKDGKTSSLFTQNQQLWSATIATGDTLVLSVDGTANITYAVIDADFIATGLYTSVNATNSLESWVQVLNSKLTGVTVSVVGQQLKITSNLGASNRASLVIDPTSTLVTKGMFSSVLGLFAAGKASDFILSRNTAQFELIKALVVGDELTGGSNQTEARIESSQIPGGSITFTADGHVWLLIDHPGQIIPTGVAGNTLLSVSKPSANIVRYGSVITSAFSSVQIGDYVIIWSNEVSATDRIEGRVFAKTGTTLDVLVTPAEWSAVFPTAGVLFSEGFIVLRSTLAPQKFRVTAGTKTLDQIAAELQAQTASLTFSVQEEQYLVVRSKTKDSSGTLLVVTADAQGKLLSLPVNGTDVSKDSLIAFYDSGEIEADFPLFIHSLVASGSAADPIDSYLSVFTSATSLAGRDPNELISILHPYGAVRDAQSAGESIQEKSITGGTTIGVANEALVRRLRSVDRFYVANPLDFGSKDTAVVVLDNDTTSKSFEIPFYRRATTNITLTNNPSNFNAYDVDSGTTANFAPSFGSFDFSNFKVLMQAKKTLKPTAAQTAILYRSIRWGRSGEKINVGYSYPTSANYPIASTIIVNSEVDIRINLKSGATVASSVNPSTEWNISVTPNTPMAGVDQVTYTWNGNGTAPALSLVGGEYVNITVQTEFNPANDGIFRVSTQAGYSPSATSFSVQRPTGAAVAESNKATQVNGAISFFNNAPTTAADIQAYIAANLGDYFTATLVNDGGTTGAGVIALSTYEESGFQYQGQFLKDGINWLLSSNLTGSPQFTFKSALTLPSDVGYTFNNGEEIRFIPTTMDQIRRLVSILAVTGFTTVGAVNVVDRGSKLELSTQVLGSEGAIQIIGGLANQYSIPVLDSATRVDNSLAMISADKVSAQGVHSDQWFRLQAATAQRKDALFSSNTSVTVLSNNPTVGESTIKLAGRALNQRYFGKPRHHVRSAGRTFRVEKQGSLVCMSWNNVGTSPYFLKSALNLNDTSGGTLNVVKVVGTSEVEFQILSGAANFTELSIGDLVTISNQIKSANNGTFLVTGVSNDGRQMRVLNPNAINEYSSASFTLVTNSTAGDTFTIDSTTLVAGTNFAIGGSAAATANNLAAIVGTIPNVLAVANGNVVIITATFSGASTPLVYSGAGTVTVSSSTTVGATFAAGDFAASSEIKEGDTIIVATPFAVLNQGTFRVIRRYNDSIWFENANVIEEEVTLPLNAISLGQDATTSLKVNATGHTAYVNWNGVGTPPTLENAQMGDVVNFGTDFASANQGLYMVLSSGAALQQVQSLLMPTGSQFSTSGVGKAFRIQIAGDTTSYYVWFNVNGGNTDPALSGTGLQVAILSGDSTTQVASKTAFVFTTAAGLTATSLIDTVTVTTVGSIETTFASNVNMPTPFAANVIQAGRRAFVECLNPSAVNESAVFVTGGLFQAHRPQIQFSEYEAAIAGDQFVVTGDILIAQNAGTYNIVKVIDRDTAIVDKTLAGVTGISLNGRETSVYVLEGIPLTAYKHVLLASAQPGAPSRTLIVFDTNAVYEKIDEAAAVGLTSISKVEFNTVVRKGLDSYRYNTGLIAEANRIIYGDPRDPSTYPGVGAAGAEIFVREPLTRRIQVSVDVRINTGVPFAQTAEQVRTSVGSLVNSNPVGQPIAISAIVSAVYAIPGIKAVSISSPQYDSTHDIIFIAPSEKARIIDPILDISVSQIGN